MSTLSQLILEKKEQQEAGCDVSKELEVGGQSHWLTMVWVKFIIYMCRA